MSGLVVLATIGQQRVAIDAAAVEAVIDIVGVEPVPFAPAHVIGLAAVRSQVLTVVDTAIAVGLAALEPAGRALVATIAGHRYALRVTSVEDAVPAPSSEPVFADMLDKGWSRTAVARLPIDDEFALLIDLDRLLASEDGTRSS